MGVRRDLGGRGGSLEDGDSGWFLTISHFNQVELGVGENAANGMWKTVFGYYQSVPHFVRLASNAFSALKHLPQCMGCRYLCLSPSLSHILGGNQALG